MRPSVPVELQQQIDRWDELRRWDRAELGRALRRLGLTYGEIRELIPVPKGTLAGWCRDLTLCADQVAAIKARRSPPSRAGVPVDTQRKRREEIQRIRSAASEEVCYLVGHPVWTAGTVLYWAEGSKKRPPLQLANSDPVALRLFLHWCRTFHDAKGFSAALNLHAANNEPEARQWWSDHLGGLGLENFNKTFIKPEGTGHRKNHLPFGVCKVTMRRSADAWHRTMAWIEALRDSIFSVRW